MPVGTARAARWRAGLAATLGLLAPVPWPLAGAAPALAQPRPDPFVPIAGVRELTGRLLVRPLDAAGFLAQGLDQAAASARASSALARLGPYKLGPPDLTGAVVVRVPPGRTDAAWAAELMATGDYQYAEPDWLVFPAGDPNDPELGQQWHLGTVRAPQAWTWHTGTPLVIAFVDSGVDLTHPDLAASLVPGFNAVNRLAQTSGGDVRDLNGHGTAVAGTAAAIGNNAFGGCGIGWNFGVMPIRASNFASGAAFMSDILYGAQWAAYQGVRVVSVSYAGVGSPAVEATGAYIRSRGGILVWAADNTGSDLSWFDHPSVTIVTATDPTDALAPSASFGRAIDLAAPGVAMYVPALGGGYGWRDGTSFAAPVVAGAAALVWSADPALTVDEVVQVLEGTAADLGPQGEDHVFGRGRVDVFAAVYTVLGGSGGPLGDMLPSGGPRPGPWLPAIDPPALAPGLAVRFYEVSNDLTALPSFEGLSPSGCGVVPTLDFPCAGPFAGGVSTRNILAAFDGYILAPQTGFYTFSVESSDGAVLLLDGRVVVDHDRVHAMSERSGRVGLEAGAHRLRLEFFSADGPAGLVVSVAGGTLSDQPIPPGMLAFAPRPADIDADGRVDLSDYARFFELYSEGSLRADFTGDGRLTPVDAVAFLDAYYNSEPC